MLETIGSSCIKSCHSERKKGVILEHYVEY